MKDIDVEKVFKEKFENFYGKDNLFGKNNKKKEWIKDFVNNLEFKMDLFEEISPRIQLFFASEKVLINKINNPFEDYEKHKNLQTKEGKILKNSFYVSEPKMIYEKHPKVKSIDQNHFKTLIYPKTSENDMISK